MTIEGTAETPTAPAASSSIVPSVATAVLAGAEIAVPALIPFNPLLAMALAAIKAHYAVAKDWPTLAELQSAVPKDYADLQAQWQQWVPSGDGTLKK